MATKNLSSKIEKELARTMESYETLMSSMKEYIEANMSAIADKMAQCNDMLEVEISKKSVKGKIKRKALKAKATKNPAAAKNQSGRPSGGGLLGHLINILKETNKPLTEPDICKILIENPDKYNWKSKSETTLYQTLRRAVKEKKIAESEDRSKETKTYFVA